MAHVSEIRTSGSSVLSRFADLRADLTTRFEQFRTYHRTLSELNNLSTRELDDLGISRYTLRAVAYKAAYGA